MVQPAWGNLITARCSPALLEACVTNAQELEGAEVRFGDVSDAKSLADTAFSESVDVVVSCLASRTGGKVCTVCMATDGNRRLQYAMAA